MPLAESFRRQAGLLLLLLRSIPFVAKEPCFALKGGTAINLFFRDLPRLSVDIDLTYVHVLPRTKSLGAIDKAMKRIAGRIEKGIRGARVTQTTAGEMPAGHRRFLVSFERGSPDWDLLGLPKVKRLPAIQWRQHNLDKITKNKRAALVTQLERVLGLV